MTRRQARLSAVLLLILAGVASTLLLMPANLTGRDVGTGVFLVFAAGVFWLHGWSARDTAASRTDEAAHARVAQAEAARDQLTTLLEAASADVSHRITQDDRGHPYRRVMDLMEQLRVAVDDGPLSVKARNRARAGLPPVPPLDYRADCLDCIAGRSHNHGDHT